MAYLVDVVHANDLIKCCVQIIQQIDHLETRYEKRIIAHSLYR